MLDVGTDIGSWKMPFIFEMAWVSDPEFKKKLIEGWPKRNAK
jgi:hypothetical protein